MKFTFRKEKAETGLAGVGHPYPDTTIKLNKLPVGTIHAPNWRTKDHKWGISLTIKQEPTLNDPADFRWVRLKKRFDTEPEARQFLQDNFDLIIAFDLYQERDP